ASAFIRMVQNTPTIFSESRVIQMENDSQKFEKIGFGQRILRAADEGKALAKDQLTAPVTSTVELNAKEVIAEVNITYDTLENNIEKDGLQQTLMQMLAERAAVDIEELIVNGDVASSDPYLAQLDGIRKQSVSHIVDAGGEQISRQLFKQGLKAVPAKNMRVPQEF
ncbi:phage major capsid protein, partial [Bacillus licheniformis]